MARLQEDLVQIVANGGCLDLTAGVRSQMDLVQLAANAKGKAAKIILRDLGMRSTTDLIQIAANAPGQVTFVLD